MIVGGCTFAEISALRFLEKRIGKEFLIVTTDIINGDTLIKKAMNNELGLV